LFIIWRAIGPVASLSTCKTPPWFVFTSTALSSAQYKLKEVCSILENSDMKTQKVVAAKEKISEGIGLAQERQMMIKLDKSSI
jgi:hypothetical protein